MTEVPSMEQAIADAAATSKTVLPERIFNAPNTKNEQPVTQSEIVLGHGKANTETAIFISAETQVQTMRWLRTRSHAIDQMQQRDNIRLSHTDQLILKYKDTLLSGTLSKDKLAVLYHGINDTIIQHAAVLGRIQREKTGELTLQADHILTGRQTKEPGSPFEKAGFSAESDYIRALGLDQMSEHVAKKGLVELYTLRQNIEISLFGDQVDTTLLGEAGTSLHPLHYLNTNGNVFHDKIVEHIGTVLTRRGETVTGGAVRAYEEIYRTNPGKAVEILRQANELALIDSTTDLANSFLSRTADSSLSGKIENRAGNSEKSTTDKDALVVLEKAQTDSIKKYDDANVELQQLKETLKTLTKEVEDLNDQHKLAKAYLDKFTTPFQTRITGYQTDYDRANTAIASTGLDAKGLTAFKKDQELNMKNAATERDKWQNKLDEYIRSESELATKLTIKKAAVKKLSGHTAKKAHVDGLIDEKEKEITEAGGLEELKKSAEKALKEAQEGAPEGKEKGKALREWKKLNDTPSKQNEILNEVLTGNFSAYSIDKLTDLTERVPGQIEGMERMRELIFKTLNNENYDPDRARKMLPDEAIAKAMTWVFRLDTQKDRAITGGTVKIQDIMTTLQTFQTELSQFEVDLNTLESASPRIQTDIDAKRVEIATKQREISEKGHDFGKLVIPELKSRSRFERGELFRFIIDQGVLSAADQGDPRLNLNDFDSQIQAMTPEVFAKDGEIFDEERFGHTQITEESIVWEDTLTRPLASRTGTDLDLTYQITLKSGEAGEIGRQMAIKTDQHFLERLPRSITAARPPWVTDEMAKLFYKDGNLRTEYQHENAWWRVWKLRNPDLQIPAYAAWDEVQHANSTSAINAINTELPGSGERIPKSVGFTAFYELSPEQRLARLRGMDSKLTGIDLDLTGVHDPSYLPFPDNYSVEFDGSGEFYIHQGANKKRWDLFFKDIQTGYKGALLQPGHTERQDVQDFLMPLLDAVGRAAINAKRYHS